MSESKLRQVAKAICKSRTCEGASCCQWPANMGRVNCNAKNGAYDEAAYAAMMVCWEEINSHIVRGHLDGNGCDKMAQRNGLILAANLLLPLNAALAEPTEQPERSPS